MAAILIIEDELVLAHQLAVALKSGGHDVRVAGTGAEGLEAATLDPPDLTLLDLRLPDRSGLDLIPELRAIDASTLIVLMTAYGSVREAVEAIHRGAADYLQKPLDLGEVGLLIERLLREQRRERELHYLRERGRRSPLMVPCEDPRLEEVFGQVQRLCDAALPPGRRPSILLTGETGTGKSMLARAIHDSLGSGPFIEVHCSAMPASEVETELFGFERGSVPGGTGSRPGLFEAADGGTLLLDEIGDLDLELQARFLEIIEDKQVRRTGSTRDRDVNVHILATTHRDLDAGVAQGRFREDLLHRLRVLAFEIPPLRERSADLRLLATRFAEELGRRYGGVPRRLAPEAETVLGEYAWPGNVRELRNVIERAVLLHGTPVLSGEALAAVLADRSDAPKPGRMVLPKEGVVLAEVERDLLEQALGRCGGNQTRASALLGISRDTLRYRVARLGLAPRQPSA